jgi:hypothetical protein
MVQHEDGGDACEDWPQQMVGTAEVQGLQAGADHGVAELFHRMVVLSETAEETVIQALDRGDPASALFPV